MNIINKIKTRKAISKEKFVATLPSKIKFTNKNSGKTVTLIKKKQPLKTKGSRYA